MGASSNADHAALTPVLVRMLDARVGSTAMMQLLASSAEIAFDRIYPYQNSYLTYLNQLAQQLSRAPTDDTDIVDFIYSHDGVLGPLPFTPLTVRIEELAQSMLLSAWQVISSALVTNSTSGARFYAEKYWGDVNRIINANMTPIIIDMVRDPRDMIASIRAFNCRHDQKLFGRPGASSEKEHLQQVVLGIALRFNEFAAPVSTPRIQIRYEDLVMDTASCVQQIEALLDVTLDAATLLSSRKTMPQHITSPSAERSIGRWRQDLSQDEASFVTRRLGPSMERYGYL